MTREEMIKELKTVYLGDSIKMREAKNMAIKALEQEPCDDAVSRQAVLDALDKSKYSNEFCEEHHIDWSINLGMAHIVVNELKPVTPQPKMGRWIRVDKDKLRCSECEVIHLIAQYPNGKIGLCPNCGCKMQEVEE